jgi:hypothetical protein
MNSEIIIQALQEKKEDLEKKERILQQKLFSNPLSEIILLRKELQKRITSGETSGPDFDKFLSEGSKKERELLSLAEWQSKNTLKAIDDLSDITTQIQELIWEIQRCKS